MINWNVIKLLRFRDRLVTQVLGLSWQGHVPRRQKSSVNLSNLWYQCELPSHTLSWSWPVSHGTPWPRCQPCSQSFSGPEVAVGGATSHLPPHIWSSLPVPPHYPLPASSVIHWQLTAQERTYNQRWLQLLHQQLWMCPTALLSSSRRTLSSLTANLCWTNLTILWPLIQPQTLATSALAAACLPPPLWTPSAFPPPHSSQMKEMPWTVSSLAVLQHLIISTRHRLCPAPHPPQPPQQQRNPGPGIRVRSARQPARGRSWGWGIWPRLCITSGDTSHHQWHQPDRPWPRLTHCDSPSATSPTCRNSWVSARRCWSKEDPQTLLSSLKPWTSSWVSQPPATVHKNQAVTSWTQPRCLLSRTRIRYVHISHRNQWI